MKKILIFVLLVVVVGGVFYFLNKKEVSTPAPVVSENSMDGRGCYEYKQVATTEAPYAVEEKIEINKVGDTVIGKKSGTQSGPDMTNGYEGTLTGTVDDLMLTAIFAYTIEGSAQKEKELYVMASDALTKRRYALKEEGDVLVPDLTTPYKEIKYTKVVCDSL